jgi:thioredoxin reductase (NADPH)
MTPGAARPRRVAVIGAGPAGIAASLQLSRQGMEPIVFERDEPGGLLREAWLVENYPGFPRGIGGAELAGLMTEHLRTAAIAVVNEEVVSLRPCKPVSEAGSLLVATASQELEVASAVVASGTSPVNGHDIAVSHTVSDKVLREVHTLRGIGDARVVIVGGGDAAFDYAVGLSTANDVTVVVRSDAARCIPPLLARAQASPRIDVLWNAAPLSVDAGPDGKPVLLCRSRGSVSRLSADYVILALGRAPATGFVSAELLSARAELAELGRLLFAGDVASGVCRQAAIAVGQGAMCGMRVAAHLEASVS